MTHGTKITESNPASRKVWYMFMASEGDSKKLPLFSTYANACSARFISNEIGIAATAR